MAVAATALIDLRPLRLPSFCVATVLMLLSGACLYGPMLLLPLFYHQARGVPVSHVGLLLAPQGVGLMAGLWVAGRWADRIGPRIVALAGAMLAAAGVAVFVVAVFVVTGDASLFVLSAGLVALGAGLGAVWVAVSATSYRDVQPKADPPRYEPAEHRPARRRLIRHRCLGILHQPLAALGKAAGQGAVDGAFAYPFTGALGFLALVLVVVFSLPATPPMPPPIDHPKPESRTATCEP